MKHGAKILILSVKAGAGHLRAAAAIQQAFNRLHPGIEVRNYDALEFTNPAFQESYSRSYEKLVANLPSIWKLVYEQMERKPVDSSTKRLATFFDRLNAAPILRLVEEYAPHAVICTHYLPAEILGARRRKGKLAAALNVVLTDYDIHTMWIQEGVDRYFVATEEMAFALREKGIGRADVRVTGIPIMPVFSDRFPPAEVMQRRLGLRVGAPTVLVAAGGFGMAALDAVVSRLVDACGDIQILAVAGRNERLFRELVTVSRSYPGKVIPMGYVENMHELMAASDFSVTKSGGITSSECLAMGLPMVIYNPIPGQEERNADYLLESGAAVQANSPAHLVFKVRQLLHDGRLLKTMQEAARRAAHPRAAFDIVETVVGSLQ